MSYESYKIAAGYNVGSGSLVNIESITPTNDEPFAAPKALPLYDDGLPAVRGDGLITLRGFAAVTWQFGRLTFGQYSYLKSTYCGGGLSGLVTINTTLGGSTYSRMNAVMVLKKPKELHSEYRYTEAEVEFTKLEAAS